ncbi:hypothetical protein RI367_002580 [Sorochytrium milnesiophthora]
MGNIESTARSVLDDGHNAGAEWRQKADFEAQERGRCFEASRAAYARGDKAEAKLLSDKGKEHGVNMERYNQMAADEAFAFHNNSRQDNLAELDLHGLYVKEALQRVGQHIQRCKKAGVKQTVLITGRGKHSADGLAKIRPAVEQLMHDERLRATPGVPNEGCILVEFDVAPGQVGWGALLDNLLRGGCRIM